MRYCKFNCLIGYKGEADSKYIEEMSPYMENIYDIAAEMAFSEMQFQFDEIAERRGRDYYIQQETLDRLSEGISEYFSSPKKGSANDYDIWFYAEAEKIAAFADLEPVKACALVDETLKHLYLCKDLRRSRAALFEFCHIPLSYNIMN